MTATPPRGLTLDVLRPAHGTDCTNGGISATANMLTLVGVIRDHADPEPLARHSRVFAATDDAPPVLLHSRTFGEDTVLSLVPAQETKGTHTRVGGWWMAGGNFAATTDSRLADLAAELTGHRFYGAIAVHDRSESCRECGTATEDATLALIKELGRVRADERRASGRPGPP